MRSRGQQKQEAEEQRRSASQKAETVRFSTTRDFIPLIGEPLPGFPYFRPTLGKTYCRGMHGSSPFSPVMTAELDQTRPVWCEINVISVLFLSVVLE